MPDAPRTRNQPDTGDLDPWERQPQEGPEAYEAFVTYRDQDRGQRSVRRAGRTLGKNMTTIGGWSSTHGWVARVAAYDRHLDALTRREREQQAIAMGRRQATQLEASAQALMQPVQALLSRISEARRTGADPFASMSIKDLARLAAMAARYVPTIVEAERLVAGLSTANVADGAPASVEEAVARAEKLDRSELEDYLLGLDDGRRDAEARAAASELAAGPA